MRIREQIDMDARAAMDKVLFDIDGRDLAAESDHIHADYSRRIADVKRGEKLVTAMADFVNVMSDDDAVAGFLDALDYGTHRTLQAKIIDLMMQTFKRIGDTPEERIDARNEFAVKAAKAGYRAMVDALNGATRVTGA